MAKSHYVYIWASRKGETLYVGVTSNLSRRIYDHRVGVTEGFTKKYGVKRLVHIESFEDPLSAIEREKNLKKWKRAYKIALIEETNPDWRDLYNDINQ